MGKAARRRARAARQARGARARHGESGVPAFSEGPSPSLRDNARTSLTDRSQENARRDVLVPADWSSSPASSPYAFVETEEQRAMGRMSQRELGHVHMALRPPGGLDWVAVQLEDFTSIGFGVTARLSGELSGDSWQEPLVARPEASPATGREGSLVDGSLASLRAGDEVEVRIRLAGRDEFTVWCRVRNLGEWKGRLKAGLRRLDLGLPREIAVERRESRRLALSPALALKARIRHPFLYGHWCILTVSDMSGNLGFSFLSHDASILLFEGMRLDIHFELAALRQDPMAARVVSVHASAPDQVRFGVECLAVDLPLHNALCDYLLFTHLWDPARLRRAGFLGKQVRSHLRFTTVRTMDDYAEVLYLRRDAYVGAGKRPQGTVPERMSSPLDGKSRILMARHHGRLVGTMTFTFPSTEDAVLDTQSGFPGCKYPVALPPKANMIETARLCIDENYRGTDLLVGMFEHGLKHFLMSDRHWLISSTTDELWPLYRRIGFVKLKASYKHPLLNNLEHHLIIAHRSAFLWGFGIGPLCWNSVFGDLVRYLLDRKLVDIPRWMRVIIRAKLWLRPLARRLTDVQARRAFRRHLAALRARRSGAAGNPPDFEPAGSLYPDVEVDLPEARMGPGAA